MKNITLLVSLGVSVLIVGLFASSQPPLSPLAPLSLEATSRVTWTKFPWPTAASHQTESVYQPFAHGFMVWRSDENCVYALVKNPYSEAWDAVMPQEIPVSSQGYGYCLVVDAIADRAAVSQESSLDPQGPLTRIWMAYGEVQTKLGAPTAAAQSYTAAIPSNEGQVPMNGLPFTVGQMTLPDGSTLSCGSRAATSGSCYVALAAAEG